MNKLESLGKCIRDAIDENGLDATRRLVSDIFMENASARRIAVNCDKCSGLASTSQESLVGSTLYRCENCTNEMIVFRGSVRTMRSKKSRNGSNFDIVLRCYDEVGDEKAISFSTSAFGTPVEMKSGDRFSLVIYREFNGHNGISVEIKNHTVDSASKARMADSQASKFISLFSVQENSFLLELPPQFDPEIQAHLERRDKYLPDAIETLAAIISGDVSKDAGLSHLHELYSRSQLDELRGLSNIYSDRLAKRTGARFYIESLERLQRIAANNSLQARRPSRAAA